MYTQSTLVIHNDRLAQWLRRPSYTREIAGSNPASIIFGLLLTIAASIFAKLDLKHYYARHENESYVCGLWMDRQGPIS